MKVKVNTKSNYKGLNGQWLNVQEISGTRISCLIFFDEFQKELIVDFNIKEVVEFSKI